jgi:hypothetical protein
MKRPRRRLRRRGLFISIRSHRDGVRALEQHKVWSASSTTRAPHLATCVAGHPELDRFASANLVPSEARDWPRYAANNLSGNTATVFERRSAIRVQSASSTTRPCLEMSMRDRAA